MVANAGILFPAVRAAVRLCKRNEVKHSSM